VSEAGKEEVQAERRSGEDLSQLVKALREAVMELRETVTELTNPLNKLSYSNESEGTYNYRAKVEAIPLSNKSSEENKSEGLSPPSNVDNIVSRKETSEALTSKNESVTQDIELHESNLESMNYMPPRAPTNQVLGSTGSKLQRILRLMRVIFNLRGRVSPELLERYIDIFVGLRLITRDEAELVKNVLRAINEGYANGLGPEEQILLMTLLAKGLGINDEVLEEEALRVIAENLVRRNPSRGGNGPRARYGEALTDKAG